MPSETTIPTPNPKGNLLISQFRRENESWRRTLEFLIEEDIILKAGISEVLKNMSQTDEGILKKLEHFHNLLIKQNDIARLLRKGVADMVGKINQDYYFEPDFSNSITRIQRILRKQMETVELEFLKLKFDFNEYIDGILQN
ncbi:MAG: hypothetical protein ABI261_00585 [Ginsengibacter sp.]